MSEPLTTPFFWDCECKGEKNYIHPKSQKTCKVCGWTREDMPDSRIAEIKSLFSEGIPSKLTKAGMVVELDSGMLVEITDNVSGNIRHGTALGNSQGRYFVPGDRSSFYFHDIVKVFLLDFRDLTDYGVENTPFVSPLITSEMRRTKKGLDILGWYD